MPLLSWADYACVACRRSRPGDKGVPPACIPLLWLPAIFCGVAWEKSEGAAPLQKPLSEKEGALPPPGSERRAQPQQHISFPRQPEAGKPDATGDGFHIGKARLGSRAGRLPNKTSWLTTVRGGGRGAPRPPRPRLVLQEGCRHLAPALCSLLCMLVE